MNDDKNASAPAAGATAPAVDLDTLRHSAAHLMAHAVLDLFPGTQAGIGPAVETGFYYDFLRPEPFSSDDLAAIEARMRELADRDIPIVRSEIPKAEAVRLFTERGQTLKVELIQEKGGDIVSTYSQEGFLDFCLGPHVASTGLLKHFKLLSVSGAYWKGDERNVQMQRIYGAVFPTAAELESHLHLLEEARKRDHRRLGPELDLYSTNEDLGGGLILWHPKGARIRAIIEQYWRERHWAGGYDVLYTPHIGREVIFQTSGHLDFYKDSMYAPMDIDGQNYYMKPMNCPFHIQIYKSRMRSYRDLPLRWAELGTVYRYERSGTLHGLLRVRGFTQDDAHIFCTPDQIESEILRVLDFSLSILADFGFTDNKIELSVRDPHNPAKYCGADDRWRQAEASLVKALETRGLPYERMEGEAVFYGPKIDIKIKDALGRSWQCATVQCDFTLPERFDLAYVGEDGARHRPVMVHRVILGSIERFVGVLTEHFAGAFPAWLAPVQARLLTVTDAQKPFAEKVLRFLLEKGIRAEADLRNEKLGFKIREAQLEKIPYMLVVGDKEVEAQAVNVRLREGGDPGLKPLEEAAQMILDATQEPFKRGGMRYSFSTATGTTD